MSSIILVIWWCDGSIMFTNHEPEVVGWYGVFPTTFANLEFHNSTWLFVYLSDYVYTFHMSRVIFESSRLHKVKNYHLTFWKFLSGTHIKTVHPS